MSIVNKLILKYKGLPTVIKATVWITFAMLLQKALMSLAVPIITRFLTLDEYANYSVYQTWFNVFIILCTFNLSSSIFNTLLIEYKDQNDKITSIIIFFEFFVTAVVFLGFYLITSFTGPLLGITEFQGMLLFLQIIVNIPVSVWIAKQKFQYKYLATTIVIVIQSILTITLNILAIIYLEEPTNGLIITTIFVYGLVSLVILILILKKNRTIFDAKIWKYAFVIGFPLIFHYLSQNVLTQSNKLLIQYYIGEDQTAIYSLSTSIAFILQTLIMAIHSSYMPWLYRRLASNNNKYIALSSTILLLIICIMTLNISLLGPEIVYIFGGSKYAEGIYLIPPLSSSIIVLLVYNFYSSLEFYYGETKLVSLATIIAAIFHLIVGFIVIPWLGYISAAYITIISYLLMCIMHYVFSKKVLIQKNNQMSLYNDRALFIIMVVGILLNALVLLTYSFTWLRYGIILAEMVIVIIILITQWKRINEILSKYL